MKKLLKLTLLFVILFVTLLELDAKELLRDTSFSNGIKLLGTIDPNAPGNAGTHSQVIGKLCRSGYSCNPAWSLAEWNSKMSLIGGNPGNYWANPYKALTVWNKGIRFALNGTSESHTESNGCPTVENANWPSLILEQTMHANISNLKSLNLKFTATLEYFNKVTKNNCYATQLLSYMIIRDRVTGANFWYGTPLFDNRMSVMKESIHLDGRTEMKTYNPKTTNLLTVNNKGKITNSQITVNLDLLPSIKAILPKVGININNAEVTYVSFGVENPSNNIATFRIENISLSGDTGTSTTNPSTITKNKIYNFNSRKNREGWRSSNMVEQYGGPYGGKWYFACDKFDPMLFSPKLSFNGSQYKKVQITMANAFNPSKYSYIKVYWKRKEDRNFSETRSAYTKIYNDGGWRTYTLYPKWSGVISEIRIDPIAGGDGHWIGIDSIKITR